MNATMSSLVAVARTAARQRLREAIRHSLPPEQLRSCLSSFDSRALQPIPSREVALAQGPWAALSQDAAGGLLPGAEQLRRMLGESGVETDSQLSLLALLDNQVPACTHSASATGIALLVYRLSN